ncbi:MAG TPA: NUDIX hydrolase [Vicinamibacterales bacterium]|nr:NUDIX hydrolase [Vicinamibacterales bacterium]
MSVATPRPAATVVVLRAPDDSDPFEVLLVRRNDKVAFMAGAYVFPGGRVDDADISAAAQSVDASAPRSRFSDLDPQTDRSYRIAAARELREEAAVTINADDLIPLAHWVTPDIETRRYDTRFFLVRMPEAQIARHDDSETTALEWLRPADAIARSRAGDLLLPPPTWTTLQRLARYRTFADALAWACSTALPRVQPGLLRDADKTMLTLPGDPSYPTIDGWEVPEDTRFLLQDGRWQPVKP